MPASLQVRDAHHQPLLALHHGESTPARPLAVLDPQDAPLTPSSELMLFHFLVSWVLIWFECYVPPSLTCWVLDCQLTEFGAVTDLMDGLIP